MMIGQKKETILENSIIKAVITNKGQIISLYNKRTSIEMIHTSNPTGWRIITSLGEWNEHPIFDDVNVGIISETDNHAEVWFQRTYRLRGRQT